MKSFGSYSFLTILTESIKLLPRNGKLVALTAIFSVFLSLCFSALFVYSIQFLVNDIFVTVTTFSMPGPGSFNMTNPDSFSSPQTGFDLAQIMDLYNHLKRDTAILLAVEISFFLVFSIISFFSSVSTILISTHSYKAKNLSLNELLSFIYRTWTRPLITSLYVSCLSTGYSVIVLTWSVPLLMCQNLSTFWVAIFVGIPALTLYLYLLVPWILSVVVSVVEEGHYGMEGLGRAAGLVKGKRLCGFWLNVFFVFLVSIVFKGYMILHDRGSFFMLLTGVLSLLKIFQMVAYTVLYVQCKEEHGEEIELHGSVVVQYSELPAATVVFANDMP